jgi:hypothetical protein
MISSDINDPLPLTPNNIILGRNSRSVMPIDENLVDYKHGGAKDYLSQWKQRTELHARMCARWTKEYLNSLVEAQKWHRPGFEPKTGEFVLVEDDHPSKLHWPIGIIEEVYPSSRDGRTRAVLVRLGSGKKCKPKKGKKCTHESCSGKPRYMKRDCRHLARLELGEPTPLG